MGPPCLPSRWGIAFARQAGAARRTVTVCDTHSTLVPHAFTFITAARWASEANRLKRRRLATGRERRAIWNVVCKNLRQLLSQLEGTAKQGQKRMPWPLGIRTLLFRLCRLNSSPKRRRRLRHGLCSGLATTGRASAHHAAIRCVGFSSTALPCVSLITVDPPLRLWQPATAKQAAIFLGSPDLPARRNIGNPRKLAMHFPDIRARCFHL